jgi:hypothetical protein
LNNENYSREPSQQHGSLLGSLWTGEMPASVEAFRRTSDAAKKYVVSGTLGGSIGTRSSFAAIGDAVQKLKQESRNGLYGTVGAEFAAAQAAPQRTSSPAPSL